MIAREMLAERLKELCAAGLLEEAIPVHPELLRDPWAVAHGIVAAIDGVARADGHEFHLRLGLTRDFPDRLPCVRVLRPELVGRVPHVLHHGHVCFHEPEGLLLDRYRPVEIAREALELALETVRRGLTGENRGEFIDELPMYWPGLPGGIVFFSADAELRPVFRFLLPTAGTFAFVHDLAQARELLTSGLPPLHGPEFSGVVDNLINLTWIEGLYIPLTTLPVPPDPFPLTRWTRKQLAHFIRHNLSASQVERLAELTSSKRGKPVKDTFVVLRVPRSRGGDHLVGIAYDKIRGYHPLSRAPGSANFGQFRIERRDPGYLVPRGGGVDELRAKRVLLVGCGSVGGHLAMELARCGVGRLTLVDPDPLRPENAHRHVLGTPPPLLLATKAMLLGIELQKRYPGIQVDLFAGLVERGLDAGAFDLGSYDLVVSATGDHNVDRALNSRLYRCEGRPPLMFTWLEPLGIGGHALVVHPQGEGPPRGCLDCLFTPHPADTSPVLANRAAFAAPGQTFTRELTGCGNTFTPYSSLDALRTAGLAARFAIETLRGDLVAAPLRSWKGSAAEFRGAGYRTSPRHGLDVETLEHRGFEVVAGNCRVCGAG